jgi:threonine dehydrogenase-like Zn-dependent dehydrogenase
MTPARIVVVDPSDQALELASTLGADETVRGGSGAGGPRGSS